MNRLTRILACFMLIAFAASALVSPVTIADIAGNSAVTQLKPIGYTARWIVFFAPSGNSNPVRVGDSNISSTQGIYLTPGTGYLYPPIPPDAFQPTSTNNFYDLSTFYYLVQTGDKVVVTWAQ